MTQQPGMTEMDVEMRYDVQDTARNVVDAASEAGAGFADTTRRAVANAREKRRDEWFTETLKRLQGADTELEGQLAQSVKRQRAENARFDARLDDLVKEVRAPKRGGGLSLFPLLLIGVAGYFAWRNNSVRARIQGLVHKLKPGAQGNAKPAEDAVPPRTEAVQHGESSMDAARTASGEVQLSLEKSVDNATDAAQDVQRGAGQGTDAAQAAKAAMRRAQENAGRTTPDVGLKR